MFCISLTESRILLALIVNALRTEWVVNTVISIPAIARNGFIYLAIDCELIGVNGKEYDKINSCWFPSRFFLTRSVLLLYFCMQSMIHKSDNCPDLFLLKSMCPMWQYWFNNFNFSNRLVSLTTKKIEQSRQVFGEQF